MSASEQLSRRELEYYSRQIVLKEIGYNGQLRLRKARVCLVGVGGLGSPIATQLAAIGIGHLRLVDRDIVEYANLHRQYLYDADSIGYPKVEIAAKKLRKLNPNVEVEPLPLSVTSLNASEVVNRMDVVVDGLDHMAPRYAVNRASVKQGIPYVFGSAITTMGNVSTMIPGKTPCLECFYGNLKDSDLASCSVVGIHPSVLSIIAGIEVSETVKLVLGEEPTLAGELLICNLTDLSFDRISVNKSEECPVCGARPKKQPMVLKEDVLEEVCGREGQRTFVFNPGEPVRVNMDLLYDLLDRRRLEVTTRAEMGATFTIDGQKSVTILSSGVMIVEGFRDGEEVRRIYKELVVEGLNVRSDVMS